MEALQPVKVKNVKTILGSFGKSKNMSTGIGPVRKITNYC